MANATTLKSAVRTKASPFSSQKSRARCIDVPFSFTPGATSQANVRFTPPLLAYYLNKKATPTGRSLCLRYKFSSLAHCTTHGAPGQAIRCLRHYICGSIARPNFVATKNLAFKKTFARTVPRRCNEALRKCNSAEHCGKKKT